MSLSASAKSAAATVAREAAVDAALAVHSQNRAASRHLPTTERKAARRASSAACMAAIDEAHAAFRAAIAPPVAADPAIVHFRHEFAIAIPGEPAPLKAVADLRTHLGVPEVDRVTLFRPGDGRIGGLGFFTALPGTDLFKRALREIRGPQAGAIRRRAFELAAADAELALIASW